MPSKRGMQNVTHTPVKLGKPTLDVPVEIQVNDATDKLFLHQRVLEVEDEAGEEVVSVDSGSGLGGDFIAITYMHSDGSKRRGVAYMREIAAAWIGKIDPNAEAALLKTLTPDRS